MQCVIWRPCVILVYCIAAGGSGGCDGKRPVSSDQVLTGEANADASETVPTMSAVNKESIARSFNKVLATFAARDPETLASMLKADGPRGVDIAKAQAARIMAGKRLYESTQTRFPGPDVSDAIDAAGVPNPEHFAALLYYSTWTVTGDRATGRIEDEEDNLLPPIIKSDGEWKYWITPDGAPEKADEVVDRLNKEAEAILTVVKQVDAKELTDVEALETALGQAGLVAAPKIYRPSIVLTKTENGTGPIREGKGDITALSQSSRCSALVR